MIYSSLHLFSSACAFSALIHDVDHSGVPNAQLVKEGSPIAMAYENKSPAEQNSLAISWNLLMLPEFDELRSAIAPSNKDLQHFRQLVINVVMATDIADKNLKDLRNSRWARAFNGEQVTTLEDINRKATIVIEHLIQASDISHTMQHWYVYASFTLIQIALITKSTDQILHL